MTLGRWQSDAGHHCGIMAFLPCDDASFITAQPIVTDSGSTRR
ncbi:hypothetical protein ACFUIY_09110 [Streptomyces griseorubiginosus]